MQAANKMSQDGVSSSQPPELEEKSSKAKTAKSGMLMSWDDVVPRLVPIVRLLGLLLVLVLVLASNMCPLWLREVVMRQRAPMLVLVPMPMMMMLLVRRMLLLLVLQVMVQILKRYMDIHKRTIRTCTIQITFGWIY